MYLKYKILCLFKNCKSVIEKIYMLIEVVIEIL